jgi:hypothetical protein
MNVNLEIKPNTIIYKKEVTITQNTDTNNGWCTFHIRR